MSKIVLPKPEVVPFTQYKNIFRNEINAYFSLLRAYNAPFKQLANYGPNNTIQFSPNYSQQIYNPPAYLRRPPWVSSQVDVLFEQDIVTYQRQLVLAYNNRNDVRMVRVLNNPPEPQPPPKQFIKNNVSMPIPYKLEATEYSDDPNQNIYINTWINGRQYMKPNQNYERSVFYNPPPKNADFSTALRHYTILYEQIRTFHSINTGGEVFTLQFTPPVSQVTGSNAASYAENFTSSSSNRQAPVSSSNINRGYTCIENNTEREQWYLNQVIDTIGKRKLQAEFCRQKELQYDATKCGLFKCLQPDTSNTTEAKEPETGLKYLYNQIKFNESDYPEVDDADYSVTTAPITNFRQTNIDEYYKILAKYNFNWTNKNGWRKINNDNKIYNPPIPAWITTESATGADRQFLNAIDEFNTQALEKLQRFNNYEPMNLPADFGALPDMPPYPTALHTALESPQEFVVPSAIGTIPQDSASGIKFTIPIKQLPQIYNSVKKQKPASASASQKPKCGTKGGSESCMLYDDEVSPAAQKLLDMMLKKKADRVSTAGYEYAMSKPTPDKEVVAAKLNSFYDSIRPEILKNVENLLGK